MKSGLLRIFAFVLAGTALHAHETGFPHSDGPTNAPYMLPFVTEQKKGTKQLVGPETKVTGTGYWTFAAARDLVPTPPETKSFLKGAHGTIIVDRDNDLVYWGLEKVGWVEFSDGLKKSRVIKGDARFASGNIHGADLLPRKGFFKSKAPLVIAADNVEGEVYLSDTTFQNAQKIGRPAVGAYQGKGGFAPTDAAFINEKQIYVTDGYGSQWFMSGTTEPLGYQGEVIGGRLFSRTPHGITKGERDVLLVAARPEAQIKQYLYKKGEWLESLGLPPGSTVCDVDVWGDYALAPCLDGPKGADGKPTPGPIYIVNLKTKAIVSTLRMKEDLGFEDALHIHDAAWYVRGGGHQREVYIIFTNWNPGGVGAIRLVGISRGN
jgi:hypothetical protein